MFSDKEQKGVFILVLIIIGFVVYKNYYRLFPTKFDIENIEFKNIKTTSLDSILNTNSGKKNNTYHSKYNNKNFIQSKHNTHKRVILFDFDPNHISKDSLMLLGISSKVAYNWTKYLSNGGKFNTKNDVKKIYGISDKLFERIKNNINLPETIVKPKYKNNKQYTKSKNYNNQSENTTKPKNNTYESINVELNSCTKEELIKLRGIGEVLSSRILKFRDKLGGFVALSQLNEVYGLSPETFNHIKPNIKIDKSKIKKIKINTANKSTLNKSPYLNYRMSSQIINYRKQHGNFKNINDLLNIRTLDNALIKKIEPYLDFAIGK